MDEKKRETWIAIAESLTPSLTRHSVLPHYEIKVQDDDSAFQNLAVIKSASMEEVYNRKYHEGDSFILDFGEHVVGYLALRVLPAGGAVDSPLRLKITFGEIPAEIAKPFDPYNDLLGRSWLQDEIVNIDVLPAEIMLPRRYAFRYVKIEVVAKSCYYQIRFEGIHCETVTSADESRVKHLPLNCSDQWKQLDEVSCRTLRNCMQTVFEDGPKRDRRLWLGDLRLQALVNYETYKNYDLVKRCLYLFAGLAREDGAVPACVYEKPSPARGDNKILDYCVLFGPTLLDYALASKDWQTAKDLWPVAKRQIETAMIYVNGDGLFVDPGTWWIFIDWSPALHRQTAMNGVLIYALRQMIKLADGLGLDDEVLSLNKTVQRMTAAARTLLSEEGLFLSGPDQQISWASQVWMILAEVVTPDEGIKAIQVLQNRSGVLKPTGPYLYHYAVEAMLKCGLKREAYVLLEEYWGGMISRGATTFWEVFDPSDDFLSPYHNMRMNSYCHAWSCTPSYFIRKNK
jgi:hypothetical protein